MLAQRKLRLSQSPIKKAVWEKAPPVRIWVLAFQPRARKACWWILPLVPRIRDRLLMLKGQQDAYRRLCGKSCNREYLGYLCVDEIGNIIRPKDRVDGRCSGKKRMARRIKFICPFFLAEHQGVEPWHRSPGLSHFECDLLRPLE